MRAPSLIIYRYQCYAALDGTPTKQLDSIPSAQRVTDGRTLTNPSGMRVRCVY